jgi:hypothetical protein
MSLVEFSEEEFNEKALEIVKMSELLNDNWKINEKLGKIFLTKQQKIVVESQQEVVEEVENDPCVASQIPHKLISIEYHVLFHPSYQVPVLYFHAHSGGNSTGRNSRRISIASFVLDGTLIPLEDLSSIFVGDYENTHQEMKNVITQAEHPILFRPFFMVHPCKVR